MPTLPVRYPLSLVLGETTRARVVLGNADASDRRSGWSAAEIDEMEGEEGKGGREGRGKRGGRGGEEGRLENRYSWRLSQRQTPSLTTGQLSSHLF